MRAWQVVERGRAELVDDAPVPDLDPDDPHATVVEVHAAAANFADRLMIDGKYQLRPRTPFVPGFEVAGRGAGDELEPAPDRRPRRRRR
jgi:NADPH:quinone reductase